MDKAEKHHPKALQESVDSSLNLFAGEVLGLFDDVEADKEGEESVLPEGEKDDCLDGDELEDGFVRINELANGDVQLNETVHSHSDGNADDERTPDVCKPGHPAMQTVIPKILCADSKKSAERSEDGVLQHADLHEPQKV